MMATTGPRSTDARPVARSFSGGTQESRASPVACWLISSGLWNSSPSHRASVHAFALAKRDPSRIIPRARVVVRPHLGARELAAHDRNGAGQKGRIRDENGPRPSANEIPGSRTPPASRTGVATATPRQRPPELQPRSRAPLRIAKHATETSTTQTPWAPHPGAGEAHAADSSRLLRPAGQPNTIRPRAPARATPTSTQPRQHPQASSGSP